MKFETQLTGFTCGVAAIRNSIIALKGKPPTERTIRQYTKTDRKWGTQPEQIIRAFTALGYKSKSYRHKTETAFTNRLLNGLRKGAVICIVDCEEHYITAIKYDRKTRIIYVVDSAIQKKPIEYSLSQFQLRAANIKKKQPKEVYYELITVKV